MNRTRTHTHTMSSLGSTRHMAQRATTNGWPLLYLQMLSESALSAIFIAHFLACSDETTAPMTKVQIHERALRWNNLSTALDCQFQWRTLDLLLSFYSRSYSSDDDGDETGPMTLPFFQFCFIIIFTVRMRQSADSALHTHRMSMR